MTNILVTDTVFLDQKPLVDVKHSLKQVTIGDLHGNLIKLLYLLVRHGVVDISATDYASIVALYRTPTHLLVQEQLDEYRRIIDRIQVLTRNRLVRLIGDELADRGQNDYFTLKLLQKLYKEQVPMAILISNHGMEFVLAYEYFFERGNLFQVTVLDNLANSLKNLQNLVEMGLVDSQEVLDITDKNYKPNLKLVDYSLNEDRKELTLFTHAGVGLETIELLAQKMEVLYEDDTVEALAYTLDRMNIVFTKHLNANTVHFLIAHNEISRGFAGAIRLYEHNPLEFLMWNRDYGFGETRLKRPTVHKGYRLNFVHGHDPDEETSGNIINLDNCLGKSIQSHTGTYTVLVSGDNYDRS